MKNFVYLLITANQIDKGVVTAIKELSLLKLCEEVANPQQLKIVQKGSFLKEEEQNNRLVYIVKSGLFRIGVEYQQSTLPLSYIIPGESVGLMGLLQAINRPCYFEAVIRSEVYYLDYSHIKDLIVLEPELALAIKKHQSRLIIVLMERIKSLVFYSPFQRLVSWIAEYNRNKTFKEMRLWALLTADDMAAYCHMETSEFLGYLNELSRLGAITIEKHDCHVNDWGKLNQFLQTTK
ncbi:MAG: Crp/Fnr family transcriptional regulator [Bacteroidota bacterium]|nr:MAG: Crp/Fnr family transcriptional regulator [Bacteroidota bacterium]